MAKRCSLRSTRPISSKVAAFIGKRASAAEARHAIVRCRNLLPAAKPEPNRMPRFSEVGGRVRRMGGSRLLRLLRLHLPDNFHDSRAALDGIIQVKCQLWRIFHRNAARQLGLQSCAVRSQFADDALAR